MKNAATARSVPCSATGSAVGWIGGPAFDLFFFFGGGLLAVTAGILALLVPVTVAPLWLLWLWLIEGPHLLATYQRTYLDRQTRQQRPRLLWGSLLWFLPGPLLLLVSWIACRSEPFLLFLGAAAIWSFHHGIRQHHGVLSIYQRLNGAAASARKADSRLLHALLWCGLLLFLLVQPHNRNLLGLPVAISTAEQYVIMLLTALLGLGLLVWSGLLVLRSMHGESIRSGLFALVAAVGTTLFSLFVVGMREPLLAHPVTPEQIFMAATLVSGTLHGVQYLGITLATSRRRALLDVTPDTAGTAALATRLGRSPLLAYGVMASMSLLYLALNFMRGAAPIWSPVEPGSAVAQGFLALYWGLFLHHFWLDQKIWRPSADARLRAELGLDRA